MKCLARKLRLTQARDVTVPASPLAVRLFARVLAARYAILVVFVILGGFGIYGATRIPDEHMAASRWRTTLTHRPPSRFKKSSRKASRRC